MTWVQKGNIHSGIDYPVDSVNNKTGDVVLSAGDVGTFTSAEINNLLGDKSDTGHQHNISDVNDLQTQLDSKSDNNHNHHGVYSLLDHDHNDVYALIDHDHDLSYSPIGHTHNDIYYTETEVDSLLSDKSDTTHDHDGDYSPIGHNHDGDYAPLSHNHNDVYYTESEIDTALGGKSNTGHSHTLSDITDAGTAASKDVGTSSDNIPVLGPDGKLTTSVLPNIAIGERFTVTSESEMLSLDAQIGDIVSRTDLDNRTFLLSATDASEFSNWKEIGGAGNITSVNGQTGPTINLTTSDINEGSNLYFTNARAEAAIADELNEKSDVGHIHDDRYYTETEVDTALDGKSNTGHTHVLANITDAGSAAASDAEDFATASHDHDTTYALLSHDHNDIYYTEAEIDASLVNKANTSTVNDHLGDFDNPHEVYATQTGAYLISEVDALLADKSDTTHDHDGSYASISHDHDSDYAPISHNHSASDITSGTLDSELIPDLSATYAPASHDHDSDYAALAHNHNDLYYSEVEVDDLLVGYLPLSGGTLTGNLNLGGGDITNVGGLGINGPTTIGNTLSVTGSFSASSLTGDGSGLTNIPVSALDTTGTADDTTYLRGDGSWAEVGGAESPLTLTASDETEVPLTVAAINGQTANIQEWHGPVGEMSGYIDQHGNVGLFDDLFRIRKHAFLDRIYVFGDIDFFGDLGASLIRGDDAWDFGDNGGGILIRGGVGKGDFYPGGVFGGNGGDVIFRGGANDTTGESTVPGSVRLQASSGTDLLVASSVGLGFFGVTPVARSSATADIKDALTSYGLLQGTSATDLNLDGGIITADGSGLTDIPVSALDATGTANSAKTLRGDGSWSATTAIQSVSVVSGSVSIDASTGSSFKVTTTTDFTLNAPTNGVDGQRLLVRVFNVDALDIEIDIAYPTVVTGVFDPLPSGGHQLIGLYYNDLEGIWVAFNGGQH